MNLKDLKITLFPLIILTGCSKSIKYKPKEYHRLERQMFLNHCKLIEIGKQTITTGNPKKWIQSVNVEQWECHKDSIGKHDSSAILGPLNQF